MILRAIAAGSLSIRTVYDRPFDETLESVRIVFGLVARGGHYSNITSLAIASPNQKSVSASLEAIPTRVRFQRVGRIGSTRLWRGVARSIG
jgi:hypothetical protein